MTKDYQTETPREATASPEHVIIAMTGIAGAVANGFEDAAPSEHQGTLPEVARVMSLLPTPLGAPLEVRMPDASGMATPV